MKKQKPNLPRAPLPRQTGGAHQAAKGGKYNRRRAKEEARRITREAE